jgi:hypothetical protein
MTTTLTSSATPRVVVREWFCSQCGVKLGTWHGRNLTLKYKQAIYHMSDPRDRVMAECRRCQTLNRARPPV